MNSFEFIKQNVIENILEKYADNRVAVKYEKIHQINDFVYLSKLVGIVHFDVAFEPQSYIQGTRILHIERLRIDNNVLLEENSEIEDFYVNDGQIVMYDTPLFLVKVLKE
ncbi:MAG: hypothetical protein LBI13_01375 [Streptococcaceae bacterium]|nr:hypothetical protein [Streptococcaceae bacterium]